ncbi:MAG: PA0069 family radical SAM protein [Bacteroidota bacterium]
MNPNHPSPKPFIGRGAGFNPPNRFEEIHTGRPPTELEDYFELPDPRQKIPTRFYVDRSKTLLSRNDSPDLGFSYSLNPYRGCEHGCIYCYARPSHEYLGFSSGIDFETKIMVKLDAPALLEEEFSKRSWKPQTIVFSGNTDCYQPAERTLQLTRRCLQVFARFRHPVSLITKNALIQRDIDVLKELASRKLVFVVISITTLDQNLAKIMEPRTSAVQKRLETVTVLAENGIPVGVNVAPIIPGLTESEIPTILQAASERGARHAGYTIVRLSHSVKDLFQDWLHRELPERAAKVLGRIRDVRRGKLSESGFGKRMSGEGGFAEAIDQLFEINCRKFRLNEKPLSLSTQEFLRPGNNQLAFF